MSNWANLLQLYWVYNLKMRDLSENQFWHIIYKWFVSLITFMAFWRAKNSTLFTLSHFGQKKCKQQHFFFSFKNFANKAKTKLNIKKLQLNHIDGLS